MQASSAVVLSAHLAAGAQRTLAELAREGVLPPSDADRLVARGDLDPEAARTLLACKNRSPSFKLLAARRVSEPDALLEEGGLKIAEGVAWNPSASEGVLEKLTSHQSKEVRLRALCNPATPEKVRREKLQDPAVAYDLTYWKSPLGAQVVRAGVLAHTNRFLAEGSEWQKQAPAIQRAIATLPEAPKELLESKLSYRWSSAATHPRRSGQELTNLSTEILAEQPSGAAHLEAIGRRQMTLTQARRILQGHETRTRHLDPEPHVIAFLVNRFGADLFVLGPQEKGPAGAQQAEPGKVGPYAGTRIATATWASPESWLLLNLFAGWSGSKLNPAAKLQDGRAAASLLEDDKEAWSVFLRLSESHGYQREPAAQNLAELALNV